MPNRDLAVDPFVPATEGIWTSYEALADEIAPYLASLNPPASDVSVDDSGFTEIAGDDAQEVFASIDGAIAAAGGAGVPTSRLINTTSPLAGGGDLSADRTLTVGDASDTAKGVVELATVAETNTGTDAGRALTPDGLAGSYAGTESVTVEVFPAATALATGDGKKYFKLPSTVNGMNLVAVSMSVFAKSTSGNPTVMLARGRQANATTAHAFVDMLSTALTIDANDFDSKDATTPAVINTSNDDVLTGDLIRIDVDAAGTAATGLFVTLEFRLP